MSLPHKDELQTGDGAAEPLWPGRDQSGPIIMCLWSANYLRQRQEGFAQTTKAQQRCWSSCVRNGGAAEAGSSRLQAAEHSSAHTPGPKSQTKDSGRHAGAQAQMGSQRASGGRLRRPFPGDIRPFAFGLMRRKLLCGSPEQQPHTQRCLWPRSARPHPQRRDAP